MGNQVWVEKVRFYSLGNRDTLEILKLEKVTIYGCVSENNSRQSVKGQSKDQGTRGRTITSLVYYTYSKGVGFDLRDIERKHQKNLEFQWG